VYRYAEPSDSFRAEWVSAEMLARAILDVAILDRSGRRALCDEIAAAQLYLLAAILGARQMGRGATESELLLKILMVRFRSISLPSRKSLATSISGALSAIVTSRSRGAGSAFSTNME
jgi:uncharacterized membrane protein